MREIVTFYSMQWCWTVLILLIDPSSFLAKIYKYSRLTYLFFTLFRFYFFPSFSDLTMTFKYILNFPTSLLWNAQELSMLQIKVDQNSLSTSPYTEIAQCLGVKGGIMDNKPTPHGLLKFGMLKTLYFFGCWLSFDSLFCYLFDFSTFYFFLAQWIVGIINEAWAEPAVSLWIPLISAVLVLIILALIFENPSL